MLAVTLVLTGCGAAEESAPVVVGSLTTGPAAPAPLTSPTPTSAVAAVVSPAADPAHQLPSVDPFPDQPLIDHTEWTDDTDGRRLHIYPTDAGRRDTFPAAADRAWQEVLAGAPDADTPGMRDQFLCHWEWARVIAPAKTSWNIEPWRPEVGYDATVAALCNPGGPER